MHYQSRSYATFIFFALFLMSLWDIYHKQFGRIFDLLGVAMFFLVALMHHRSRLSISLNELLAFLIVFLLLLAVPDGGHLTHCLVLVGVLLFITARRCDPDVIRSLIFSLIVFLVIFQWLDFVLFKLFLTPHSFYPTEYFLARRNWDANGFFRPVGFFAEANAFASTISVLYLSQWRGNGYPPVWLNLIVMLALLMSKSIFGWLMANVFCFAWGFRAFGVFGAIASLLINGLIDGSLAPHEFIHRFVHFSEDPSFNARLGTHEFGAKLGTHEFGAKLGTHEFDYWRFLLPSGFHSIDKSALLGSNGFSFIIDGLGFFAILFYALILYALGPVRSIIFLSINITYPVYLMFLFYIVMGVTFSRRL